MSQRPWSTNLAALFIFTGASAWMLFGGLLLLDAHPAFPDEALTRVVIGTGAVGAGLILMVLLMLLRRGPHLAYYGVLAALGAASLALFLDDFGASDLILFLVTLTPIYLLLKDRRWYLRAGTSPR